MPPLNQYKPDWGVYTDSASYADIIPECTNVSVGYFDQHGSDEKIDMFWLEHIFIPAVMKIDWSALVVDRKPVEYTPYVYKPQSDGYDYAAAYKHKIALQEKYGEFDPVKGIPYDMPIEGLAAQLMAYNTNKYRLEDWMPIATMMKNHSRMAVAAKYLQTDLDDAQQLISDMAVLLLKEQVKIPEGMEESIGAIIGQLYDDPEEPKEVKEVKTDAVLEEKAQEQIRNLPATTTSNENITISVAPLAKGVIVNVTENGVCYFGNTNTRLVLFKRNGKKLGTIPTTEGTKAYVKLFGELHHVYTVGKHGIVRAENLTFELPKTNDTITSEQQQT
jgi:hypothetical protein